MLKRSFFFAVAFVVVAGACGGSGSTFPEDTVAVRVNADLATGHERLLLAVVELDGTRLGSPEDKIEVEVAPDAVPTEVQRTDGEFIWTIPEFAGFYRAEFDFDRPGAWRVTVLPDSGDPLDTILIEVADDECRDPDSPLVCAPRVGEAAPSLATPTLADATLEDLSTDPEPDERFYRVSLDEALSNGRPSVIVFSTPAYCRTATCGPILNNVKEIADEYPGVDFVHIEVYTGLRDSDFSPDPEHLAPAVIVWTLPSEPWVFITDAAGVITARFEGALDTDELRANL